MNNLFEQSDYLSSPYEAFCYDSANSSYPITSHWHYFCEILYFIEGSANVRCDEKLYKASKGDFVFFHPQSVHSISGNEHVKIYVMKFDLSLLKSRGSHMCGFQQIFLSALNDAKAPIVISGTSFGDFPLENIFENCINEITNKNYGYDVFIQAELTKLLTKLLRIWRELGFQTDKRVEHFKNPNTLYSVVEYIDSNLNQPIKVEELAEKCNMSYSYFAKQFHFIYGRSCKEYIALMRINRAKDLLLFTNHDLNYICQETGFADCSHLIRTFKKLEGITPKQFRLTQGMIN